MFPERPWHTRPWPVLLQASAGREWKHHSCHRQLHQGSQDGVAHVRQVGATSSTSATSESIVQ